MAKLYDILNWDSDFFKFPVCRLYSLPRAKRNIDNLIKNFKQDNIVLAYYSSKKKT